jgi:hypothetical protein
MSSPLPPAAGFLEEWPDWSLDAQSLAGPKASSRRLPADLKPRASARIFYRSELRRPKMATIDDLIFYCLQLGLDGEKVDYEWKRDDEHSVVLSFEDGRKIRVALEPTTDRL